MGHVIAECWKRMKAEKLKMSKCASDSSNEETNVVDLVGEDKPSILSVVDDLVGDEVRYIFTSYYKSESDFLEVSKDASAQSETEMVSDVCGLHDSEGGI